MHIAIDARMYGTAQRGIGRYLMKLIEGLEEIVPSPDKQNVGRGFIPRRGGAQGPALQLREGQGEGYRFTIFLRRANFDEYTTKNSNFKKALWDAPWYGLREQLTYYLLPTTYCDLIHFPHWNIPLFLRRPFIVTIHDLELFSSNRTRDASTHGRFVYWLKYMVFRIVLRHAVLASRAIIVPSNVVREQLLDLYPQVRKKVHVIYEAPTLEHGAWNIKHGTQKNALRSTLYALRYVLYVGAAYPHKNLPRLLEAWKMVHAQLPEYKLVLVGREDFFWKKLKTTYYPLPTTSSTIFYGSATDAQLSALYKNAALLVQPSLEEGFSLSPLEALAHGTPAAVSDIPVHREILGNAAFYFNPRDSRSIADVIRNAIAKNARANALNFGKRILKRYSWERHARKTLQIYNELTLP